MELTYELSQCWFPEVPEQARAIKRNKARWALVLRYIDNVVATDRRMIAKVFPIFKLTAVLSYATLESDQARAVVDQSVSIST